MQDSSNYEKYYGGYLSFISLVVYVSHEPSNVIMLLVMISRAELWGLELNLRIWDP